MASRQGKGGLTRARTGHHRIIRYRGTERIFLRNCLPVVQDYAAQPFFASKNTHRFFYIFKIGRKIFLVNRPA